MTYAVMDQMAGNNALMGRVRICYVQETAVDRAVADNWIDQRRYRLACAPGWAAAWESAQAAAVPDIGTHPGVITDRMIVAEVQHEIGKLNALQVRAARASAWESAVRPATMQCENPFTNDAQDTL